MDIKEYDVVVIGGGASGMTAAIFAARQGSRVVLLEKNKRLGEKLRISGGGRCNITNAEFDLRTLLKNYGKAEKFLYSAFTKYGVKDTIDFFESLGLDVQVEAKKRAFPVSQDANDVVRVLSEEMARCGVDVVTGSRVTKIKQRDGQISAINCGRIVYHARSYVLATGGMSRPETGSTGDGFGWLTDLGHAVNASSPSITPLALKDRWVQKVAGITAHDVRITFYSNGSKSFRLDGDILFTHFGVSGPLILNGAHKVAELLEAGEVTAIIDCFPAMSEKELDEYIIGIFTRHGAKQLNNILGYCAPAGMSPALKELLGLSFDLEVKCSEVNKQMRRRIVGALKTMPVTVEKLMGMEKAVVADGGIDLREIDTRTFRSSKLSNLYITGDLLDINRPSGGFSLQLCWTTGYIAGSDAVFKPSP